MQAKTFALDSAYELKAGVGRLFDSKKTLGQRETFLSSAIAGKLGLSGGDSVIMQYDIPLILNTLQLMSDQIFPTILVNGATAEELNDPEHRAIITDDLASFMV